MLMKSFWNECFSRQSIFIVVLVMISWALPYVLVPQRRRFPEFCCTLNQPYLTVGEQIIPNLANWMLCLSAPLFFHGVFYMSWIRTHVSTTNERQASNETVSFLYGICLSASVAEGLFSTFLKRFVGRPRPYFFQRCGWDGSSCVEDVNDDAYQSFPSGHATLSFSTLGFTTLYLLGKVHLFAPQQSPSRSFLDIRDGLALLALLPMGLACWVAASRIVDHQHHTSDVVAGALLGLACAALFHQRHCSSSGSSNVPNARAPSTFHFEEEGEPTDTHVSNALAVTPPPTFDPLSSFIKG